MLQLTFKNTAFIKKQQLKNTSAVTVVCSMGFGGVSSQ